MRIVKVYDDYDILYFFYYLLLFLFFLQIDNLISFKCLLSNYLFQKGNQQVF